MQNEKPLGVAQSLRLYPPNLIRVIPAMSPERRRETVSRFFWKLPAANSLPPIRQAVFF